MPLKQTDIRTSGRRVCHHCATTKSGAKAWYFYPNATDENPLYDCGACYVYQSQHTSDRPTALSNGIRSRPTAGPCSHCAVTESVQWCWHWRDKDRVVCLSCHSYWLKHRVDRPMKREKKCTGTMPTMRVDKRLGMGAQFVPCKTTETSTRKPRRTITQTVHVQ